MREFLFFSLFLITIVSLISNVSIFLFFLNSSSTDLNSEVLKAKRANADRIKDFSKQLNEFNKVSLSDQKRNNKTFEIRETIVMRNNEKKKFAHTKMKDRRRSYIKIVMMTSIITISMILLILIIITIIKEFSGRN